VDPRAGLDAVAKRKKKSLSLPGIEPRSPSPWIMSKSNTKKEMKSGNERRKVIT
jgi:hypothetical protein